MGGALLATTSTREEGRQESKQHRERERERGERELPCLASTFRPTDHAFGLVSAGDIWIPQDCPPQAHGPSLRTSEPRVRPPLEEVVWPER